MEIFCFRLGFRYRSSHRDSFRKYMFFFSRSNLFIIFQEVPFVLRTDMNFSGGSICSSNRHEFSRRVYMFFHGYISMVLRTDTNFPGGLFEKTCFFQKSLSYLFVEQNLLSHPAYTIFTETLIKSSNTYEFSRSLWFSNSVIEQILIFQEALSSPRTQCF